MALTIIVLYTILIKYDFTAEDISQFVSKIDTVFERKKEKATDF